MRFVRGGRYRHIYFRDVDMIILAIRQTHHNGLLCKVIYAPQHSDEWQYSGVDEVFIFRKQYENWNFVPQR